MRPWILALIVLLAGCSPKAPVAAAPPPVLSPASPSDSLRAARPLTPTPAIAFDVERAEDGKHPSASRETVVLTDSFAHLTEGSNHVLFDRQLCRMLIWHEGEPQFSSLNCHAVPVVRVLELSNRRVLAKATAKFSMPDADPYWPEAELGVSDRATKPLTRKVVGDTTEYRLGDEVVVTVTGSAGDLQPAEMKRIVYWLAQTTPLHPQVRRDLGAGSTLPKSLRIATTAGGPRHQMTLNISNLRRVEAAYPLPAGMWSDVLNAAPAASPRGQGIEQAVAAANGQSKIAKPSPADLAKAAQDDVAMGRMINAQFRLSQLFQQYGGRLMQPEEAKALADVRTFARTVLADPGAARLQEINRLAGDPDAPGDRQAAARQLTSPELAGIPFGTFRFVTFANLMRAAKDSASWDPALFSVMHRDPADNYWTHIAAYPWASNAFADLGDYYLESWRATDAWLAFDLGRAIDPDWRLGVMSNVDGLEKKVRADNPDQF
jgi:hypothetical protein